MERNELNTKCIWGHRVDSHVCLWNKEKHGWESKKLQSLHMKVVVACVQYDEVEVKVSESLQSQGL